MDDSNGSSDVSRRTLLRATTGVVALSAAGSVRADDNGDQDGNGFSRRCPEATLQPSMGHCQGASADGCADDHPVTVSLREAVRETLETRYPDVGALVEAGFKPYFDTLDGDDDGWSHWLHPESIADDAVLDPERPESVLVDNQSWRSIGVMFIAVRGGEPVDSPPTVYDAEDDLEGDADERANGDDHGHDHDHADDPNRCSPWHYHAGLPGRFAWWYYQQVYEGAYREGELRLPCRTPCLLHVWTVDHPDGTYAHGGPPPEYRTREPAADPEFDTGAKPGKDELDWDALPDHVVPDRTPETFSVRERLGL